MNENAINNYSRTEKTRTCPLQTAMYGHPTYSPLIASPLVTSILSQGSATTISKGIFTFLHTSPVYSKQTEGLTALSSLIIPTCQNHHLKFTNYLMNICQTGKDGKPYEKQNFSSLITYQTKDNKIKRTDKSKHTCLFEIPRCNYFGTMLAVII